MPDCLGGPDVITGVPVRGRWEGTEREDKAMRQEDQAGVGCFGDGGGGF